MSELMEQFLELSSSPLIPSLPDDVALDIVARVPRSHYPSLSLVSKSFQKLIASPKLYKRRSQLGITQHRLYAVLRNPKTGDCRLYILHRKLNSRNRLVIVQSLPPLSIRGTFVSVGSKVYVFNDVDAPLSIDCTSHTVQPIPDMPQRFAATPICRKVANVIEGKIYLIGDSRFIYERGLSWLKTVMVLDTETLTWEPVIKKENMRVGALWSDAVVMEDKIYMKGTRNGYSVVYGPEEREWEVMDEVLNSKEWEGACVVDNVLYYLDCSKKVLRAYDPKLGYWRVVNGLEEFLVVNTAQSKWCDAVNYGEKKLALFFPKKHEGKEVVCCAEIALERRQGGEIWGKVESCDVVVEDGMFEVVKCVSVTV